MVELTRGRTFRDSNLPKEVFNQLAAVKVARTKAPGRYADGNGLYLSVSKTGGRSWVWRGVVRGRRREIGLGSVRLYSLAEARETAREYRKAAREGRDPKTERDESLRRALTFGDAIERFWRENVAPVKSEKDAKHWQSMMGRYAVPKIGNAPVSEIEPDDVLRVLRPIWLEKQETARRMLQRMRAVFDWAIVGGHRTTANPVAHVRAALPPQKARTKHFRPYPTATFRKRWTGLPASRGWAPSPCGSRF